MTVPACWDARVGLRGATEDRLYSYAWVRIPLQAYYVMMLHIMLEPFTQANKVFYQAFYKKIEIAF